MAVDTLDEKAQADTAPLGGDFESLATQKVQLDIDDAPFLDEPEEEPAPPPAPIEKKAVAKVEPEEEKPSGKKKKIIIIGAAVFLLLAVAAALYLFVFSGPKVELPQPPIITVTRPEEVAPPPDSYNIKLEPFIVELLDQEGKRHFLRAAFVLATENPMVYMEVEDKIIVLRDSIYYYLKNQDYGFLHDAANNEEVRADLATAVNDYLVQGDIDDILFDTYIIR